MLGDFHLHTYFSDGRLSPRELILHARERSVGILAVTDHDTMDAWEELLAAGTELGVHVVRGIEVTSRAQDLDAHILGYNASERNPDFLRAITRFRTERIARAERIIEKLHRLGMMVDREKILEGALRGTIGRPHIAAQLVAEGHASSQQNAFHQFLNFGLPAYEPPFQLPSEETIRLIHAAGGIAVLAHPAGYFSRTALVRLRDEGLDGVEVYHPSHDKDATRHYKKLAGELGLLVSGGSDFHGARKSDAAALGRFGIRDTELELFLHRIEVVIPQTQLKIF